MKNILAIKRIPYDVSQAKDKLSLALVRFAQGKRFVSMSTVIDSLTNQLVAYITNSVDYYYVRELHEKELRIVEMPRFDDLKSVVLEFLRSRGANTNEKLLTMDDFYTPYEADLVNLYREGRAKLFPFDFKAEATCYLHQMGTLADDLMQELALVDRYKGVVLGDHYVFRPSDVSLLKHSGPEILMGGRESSIGNMLYAVDHSPLEVVNTVAFTFTLDKNTVRDGMSKRGYKKTNYEITDAVVPCPDRDSPVTLTTVRFFSGKKARKATGAAVPNPKAVELPSTPPQTTDKRKITPVVDTPVRAVDALHQIRKPQPPRKLPLKKVPPQKHNSPQDELLGGADTTVAPPPRKRGRKPKSSN